MEKDADLLRFESGTRRFEPKAQTTLKEALNELDRKKRLRPYRRTPQQMAAAKCISDRIMGERDDS